MCMIRVVSAGSVPTAAARSSDDDVGSSASHSTRTAAVGLAGRRSSWRISNGVVGVGVAVIASPPAYAGLLQPFATERRAKHVSSDRLAEQVPLRVRASQVGE